MLRERERESDIYIMYIVCVRWRRRLTGVKYAHANHARVQRFLFLSRARTRVKRQEQEEARSSARLECVEKTRGELCRGGRRGKRRRTVWNMVERWCG